MFILKKYGKQDSHNQSVGCKYIPTGVPPGYDLLSGGRFRQSVHKTVDDGLSRQRPYGSAQTVGHHHEQPLRTAAYADVRLLVDKQGTRHIEKVESHPVNQHGQDEQPHARPRIAQRKESETEHPRQHRYEHHPLDAETAQKERYQQNAKRLTDLRYGNQDIGMLYPERVRIFGNAPEREDERTGKTIGDLQTDAQTHGKDETKPYAFDGTA